MKEKIEIQIKEYLRWKLQINQTRIDYIEVVKIAKISRENAENVLLDLYDKGTLFLYIEFECEDCNTYIKKQYNDEYLISCPTCSSVYDIRDYVKGLDYYYQINPEYFEDEKKNVIPFRREIDRKIFTMDLHESDNKIYREEKSKLVKGEKRIFIVHGHDNELKLEVANWLLNNKVEAIILHQQANGGTTSILDKIRKNSDVDCAIVLLTADDVGKDKNKSELLPRARQNVVFEAGYFIGKLGADHVILLADPKVETPGDLGGCIYVEADPNGGWKEQIRIELSAMGISL